MTVAGKYLAVNGHARERTFELLELVHLSRLMDRTGGRPEIAIGLIDGPVFISHPDLSNDRMVAVSSNSAACRLERSSACEHGTLVAGILAGRRGSGAPGIAPNCTLLVRPVYQELTGRGGDLPVAAARELAAAITETVDAGARVLNISSAMGRCEATGERELGQALSYAARRGVITVAAAGNQGTVAGSTIVSHPAVIPAAACDRRGRPAPASNLGYSIGIHGLLAPGDGVLSLGVGDQAHSVIYGTSASTPFITGAIALLWSEFPAATATRVRHALTYGRRLRAVVPPLLNAWAARHELMVTQT